MLVIAPTAKDAQLSRKLFTHAGIACTICLDLANVAAELVRGVGVVLLTEEALTPQRRPLLISALATQPTWSNLPVIVLADTDIHQLLSAPFVQQLGNVLILERPISGQTLLSVVQMQLRSRRRQYQARMVAEIGRLLTASISDETTLTAVVELLVPRLADYCLLHTFNGRRWQVAALSFASEFKQRAARISTEPAEYPEADRSKCLDKPTTKAALNLIQTHLHAIGAADPVIVPLEAQGRLLGMLSLGMLATGREFRAEDRQVVEEVAGRLALALNQVRLYHAEQAARAEAEGAVRSREELMALISHDLNNPLTTVLGQAQLLQRQLLNSTPTPERVVRGVTAIGRASLQMKAQIAELLDAARLRAGQPIDIHRTATDLVALVQAVVADMKQGTAPHQIILKTHLPELVLQVDPLRIKRVLDNLVSNAVKYSPAGGVITVAVDVETTDEAKWARVQVRDQGIGIPDEELAYMFDRFRRASNVRGSIAGTGLGLASAQQVVEQHAGRIVL
ncbi:MAG: HAMP domain-containing histidine kinase, partial [Oscillochloris sp.]|nr:HAMP domain-containing histidine kinase [Oscillochloris sp.]